MKNNVYPYKPQFYYIKVYAKSLMFSGWFSCQSQVLEKASKQTIKTHLIE